MSHPAGSLTELHQQTPFFGLQAESSSSKQPPVRGMKPSQSHAQVPIASKVEWMRVYPAVLELDPESCRHWSPTLQLSCP